VRLLILGINYAPEPTGIGPFTTGLAEHFARSPDNSVTVVTALPHYPQWRVYDEYARGNRRSPEAINGVCVVRVQVNLPRYGSAMSRVKHDSAFSWRAFIAARKLPGPDMLIAVSPPIQLAFVAAHLARKRHIPTLLLVKDLPLEAAIAVGMMRKGSMPYRAGRGLERRAYGKMDKIVAISEAFRDSFTMAGVSADKLVTIPDWGAVDQIGTGARKDLIRARLGAHPADFLVVHAGNMGQKQSLGELLRWIGATPSLRETRWALIGDGFERSLIERLCRDLALTSVVVLPLQPEQEVPDLLAAADVLLLHQNAAVLDSVAPSKLLAYMAACRPILVVADSASAAAHLVDRAACGICVPPGSPDELAAAITLLRSNPQRRQELGQAGRAFALANFSKSHVLKRWDELMATFPG